MILKMVWVTCSHLYKIRHASFYTNSLKTPTWYLFISFSGLIEPLRSWYSIIFGGPKERELMQKLNIESIPRNFNQTLHEKFHQLLHSTKKGWKHVKPWRTHFRSVRCKDAKSGCAQQPRTDRSATGQPSWRLVKVSHGASLNSVFFGLKSLNGQKIHQKMSTNLTKHETTKKIEASAAAVYTPCLRKQVQIARCVQSRATEQRLGRQDSISCGWVKSSAQQPRFAHISTGWIQVLMRSLGKTKVSLPQGSKHIKTVMLLTCDSMGKRSENLQRLENKIKKIKWNLSISAPHRGQVIHSVPFSLNDEGNRRDFWRGCHLAAETGSTRFGFTSLCD